MSRGVALRGQRDCNYFEYNKLLYAVITKGSFHKSSQNIL